MSKEIKMQDHPAEPTPPNTEPHPTESTELTELDNLQELWLLLNKQSMNDLLIYPFFNTAADAATVTQSTSSSSTGETRYNSILELEIQLGKPFGLINQISSLPDEGILIKLMHAQHQRLDSQFGPDDWFRLLVTVYPVCRDNEIYNDYIHETAQRFYKTPTSAEPIKSITRNSELFFHIIRAYSFARMKDFTSAGEILNKLSAEWMDTDESRQTNILFHNFIHDICTNQWQEALQITRRLWSIMRLMDATNRYNWGAWDDWFLAHIIMWYFAAYVPEFCSVLMKDGIHLTSLVGYKKALFMRQYDANDIASFVSKAYYNHACTLNPTLPTLADQNSGPVDGV